MASNRQASHLIADDSVRVVHVTSHMTLERLTSGKSLCIHIETDRRIVHDNGTHRTYDFDSGSVVDYTLLVAHHPEN